MKAFLMAAGLGTRLRPVTDRIPKCLVPVNNKPMIEYWFDLFRKHEITDVLINLNHFPEQVSNYISEYVTDLSIKLVYEKNLLGSLGTVIENKDFVKNDKLFYILYADTLTNIDLTGMMRVHEASDKPFTMGLFHSNNPSSCGIAEINEQGTIVEFEEKPALPKSNLANAGIYIMETSLLNSLSVNQGMPLDIGYDLLPKLVNKMNGFKINGYLIDIGTLSNLQLANEFVKLNQELFS